MAPKLSGAAFKKLREKKIPLKNHFQKQ